MSLSWNEVRDRAIRFAREAHADLDRAVNRCYRAKPFASERERVEHLFALYEGLTAPLVPAAAEPAGKPKRLRKPKG